MRAGQRNLQRELTVAAMKPGFGAGAVHLNGIDIKIIAVITANTHALHALRQRLLEVYRENVSRRTQPFPGITELLDNIEQRGLNWGIVTNKPGWLTEPLLESLGLLQRAACIVSADSTENRKPHPEPMFYACQLANSQPEECVYVGDARRDIEAGENAGMQTIIAQYGYIGDWENTDDWQADHSIQTPSQLLALL